MFAIFMMMQFSALHPTCSHQFIFLEGMCFHQTSLQVFSLLANFLLSPIKQQRDKLRKRVENCHTIASPKPLQVF